MIEGLKVTVEGAELRDLARARSDYHANRAATYAEQIASMRAAQIEAVAGMSGGDPVAALDAKRSQHENDARELLFIADHIKIGETYLLDRDALSRLGIVASRY